jgi:protein-L-isoaspartate(D-aspartate) O-methyltransferase
MIHLQKGVLAWSNYDESATNLLRGRKSMRGQRPRSRARGMSGAVLVLLAVGLAGMSAADEFRAAERHRMVEEIETVARIAAETGRPVLDARVLAAMRKVPRHEFVPGDQKRAAYRNRPLPIGEGQTISQPYIVALMTDLLELPPGAKVLEIGTGCGYQAAVLAEIADAVHSIEIVASLGRKAAATLARLGHANVKTRIGDGYLGWPEAAPFDAIIVTAAPDHIPAALLEQLKPGGRMVIPVGTLSQELMVVRKAADGSTLNETIVPVRFVPLTRGGEQ